MQNPMFGALNQSRLTGNLGQIKQVMNTVRSFGNPQIALNNAMQQNPQLKAILDESGGDYQKAFYAYAKQLGVDGDQIIGMLK